MNKREYEAYKPKLHAYVQELTARRAFNAVINAAQDRARLRAMIPFLVLISAPHPGDKALLEQVEKVSSELDTLTAMVETIDEMGW